MKLRKKWHYLAVNSRVNVEIVARSDTNHSNAKIVETKMVEITAVTRLVVIIAPIVASQDMSSKTASNSRKRTHDSAITLLVTAITVIPVEKTMSHKMWFLRRHPMRKNSQMTFGFAIVVPVHIIVSQIEEWLIQEKLMRI